MLMETFALRLRASREAAGLTQDQLADKANVSQSLITKIESGKSDESRKTTTLAIVLGVDPIWLATGKKPYNAPDGKVLAGEMIHNEEPQPPRPPVVSDEDWKALPPKARALVEELLTKTSSGALKDKDISALQNMVDALSKD